MLDVFGENGGGVCAPLDGIDDELRWAAFFAGGIVGEHVAYGRRVVKRFNHSVPSDEKLSVIAPNDQTRKLQQQSKAEHAVSRCDAGLLFKRWKLEAVLDQIRVEQGGEEVNPCFMRWLEPAVWLATRVLSCHRGTLHRVASELQRRRRLGGDDLERLLAPVRRPSRWAHEHYHTAQHDRPEIAMVATGALYELCGRALAVRNADLAESIPKSDRANQAEPIPNNANAKPAIMAQVKNSRLGPS